MISRYSTVYHLILTTCKSIAPASSPKLSLYFTAQWNLLFLKTGTVGLSIQHILHQYIGSTGQRILSAQMTISGGFEGSL